ncbi:unnamed protein product [Rotaria socialis]|uniref:RBR-type E3 ubiquitin transferase n=1 Tax=Rotaria socialis TaxID=392032 RepID=A0A818RML5_9BILA|nr:unnamed protein product [Rotaria socialis]CAF4864381.1 unnamed protein product [Rotaria socialis]
MSSNSKNYICDVCIYHRIEQTSQEMLTDDVRCPELECNRKYNYETIKDILRSDKNTKLVERYNRFMCLHQLEQMDEYIWRSNPKCQMGQLNDGGDANNVIVCTRCHTKTCFNHKTRWHTGLTCEQFNSKTDGDVKASLRWTNQNTKTRPNCPYQIEKKTVDVII